ncbi:MAG: hypothetical protein GYB68_01300, partial [Chloroflexi bacterium]|nr:hypothetical protein [Chloroflexota bacterium]
MAREIVESSFRLPLYTDYNGAGIPFAYPPLGMYLAALLTSAFGISLFTLYTWLPTLISIGTIFAAFAVARRLLTDEWEVVLTVLIFAVLPSGFQWVIAGGGITRSLGLLFLLLALSELLALTQGGGYARLVTTALLLSLCILSHLEYGLVASLAVVIIVLFSPQETQDKLLQVSLIGLLALTLTSPWWFIIISRHGLDPFLSAQSTGESLGNPLEMVLLVGRSFTGEPMLPVIGLLSIVGFFVLLAEREWMLPIWVTAILFVARRSFGATLSIAIAILAAVALTRLLIPGLRNKLAQSDVVSADHSPIVAQGLVALMTTSILIYAAHGVFQLDQQLGTPLHVLFPTERAAMEWVSQNTPDDSQFLVITSSVSWQSDAASEWFPVLASRPSRGTVQGAEWLNGSFERVIQSYFGLQACAASSDPACVTTWSQSYERPYTHVYLTQLVTGAIGPALANSPDYELVYEQDGIRIYEFKPGPFTVYLNQGDRYRSQLDFAAALTAYQTAIEFDPSNP